MSASTPDLNNQPVNRTVATAPVQTSVGSKINKRNIAIAIVAIVVISLIAVGLYFAEVNWGVLSAALVGIVWTLTNPFILGTIVTLLVIVGVIYTVSRYRKSSPDKADEIGNINATIETPVADISYEQRDLVDANSSFMKFHQTQEVIHSYDLINRPGNDSHHAYLAAALPNEWTGLQRHLARLNIQIGNLRNESDFNRAKQFLVEHPVELDSGESSGVIIGNSIYYNLNERFF